MNPRIILLVEDDEDDAFFMRRALTKAQINLPLHIAVNGQEALDYLGGVGKFGDRSEYPLPAIVFLDLKLPYVHGFEVLKWIRSQPPLNDVPVIILTSSPEPRDREKALQLGAKAYLVKPPTRDMVLTVLEAMHLAHEARPSLVAPV
jgi:CheY-like chemotaxis protein